MVLKWFLSSLTLFLIPTTSPTPNRWAFDQQLKEYFQTKVREIESNNVLTDWDHDPAFKSFQKETREQLWEMLGMQPRPKKTDLNARVTGVIEHDLFVVEKVVFESMPGLYVTGNLYRPKKIDQPLPAVIYVCGHATVQKDNYNYGAKAHYQHHPAWYARNGFICLIIDTVQLGEIEGIHHGTYRYNRWWWLSRGYTSAAIEAWNGIRAVDYLISRGDVNPDQLGLTGRSGGGATSWFVGALDERIKVVAPVAGITDLRNHVVDGCVEGHCDCMYFVNTYQWDFSKLGVLIAPRPLLIANADMDALFPLDGVYRTYSDIRKVYEKLEIPERLALNIVGGGHNDIQEIQIHPFRWFNHFLKDSRALIADPAEKFLTPEQLRVFDHIPQDQINTRIDELFVPLAPSLKEKLKSKNFDECNLEWTRSLDQKVFGGWPVVDHPYSIVKVEEWTTDDYSLKMYDLNTESNIHLPLLMLSQLNSTKSGEIQVLDDLNWEKLNPALGKLFGAAELWDDDNLFDLDKLKEELKEKGKIVYLPIRGAGIASDRANVEKLTHQKRRYYLIGQTLEGMQTWDILQGVRAIGDLFPTIKEIRAAQTSSVMLTYAMIYQPGYHLFLESPIATHDQGAFYLNVRKYLDIPEAILMASTKNHIHLSSEIEGFDALKAYTETHSGFNLHF